MSEKKTTDVQQQGWELEQDQQTEVELAVLEGRRLQLLQLGCQPEERKQCHHDGAGGSDIVSGRKRHGGSPVTVQWGQRGVVLKESVSRARLRKQKARWG